MSSDRSQEPQQPKSTLDEIRAARLEKVEQIKQLGLNPYAYKWKATHHADRLQSKYADLKNGEEVEIEVSVAGRIIARRIMGN